MNNMRALVLREYGGPSTTAVSSMPVPRPGPNQVVVRVQAAGLNGLDWKVREGFVRNAFPLALPAVLGIELAGIVEALGTEVTGFAIGDSVMGPMGGLGAYAERAAVNASHLCRIPEGLGYVEAAAVPVAALAAWQSLHAVGPIRARQVVLIHGAAGGLGGFAVQFAHRAGAKVVATARARHADYVHGLGADHVIDYETQRFEQTTRDVDLILDYVGAEVVGRSWDILSETGTLVSTATPDILAHVPQGRRGHWFMMKPDAATLATIAADIAADRLRLPSIETIRFDDLPNAIERHRTHPHLGKTVVDFNL